ncbi:GNAT family N-acetyltransferase [Entomospira culicis]|uniref:GNAT family N-acetyltransferase n=1 Tax=Entomospira culicis TaxID=2719989 RepID=A0A968KV90_9SPIO|nr:GNAT family N-acetyltransferase [Entomospira culicis]NIZ18643.1 GNAT family N-acetyltransferase [Entomospira culicis]NIZ68858.1 GNAT family N-acetyltransferase [Entomospira culicis]WDI37452.1 GNAT family N-acetyltransferase [Entomospira culicis]WDI39080.1 GNAT family N-acetyltransferase [Entomospira culicis]
MSLGFLIRRYLLSDYTRLFAMMRLEDDWHGYTDPLTAERYQRALESSIVYVAILDHHIVAYLRARDDDGFGLYIYDLLVQKEFRGHQLGKMLIEELARDYPNGTIYVMSDVDVYYHKQGFTQREGSILVVRDA